MMFLTFSWVTWPHKQSIPIFRIYIAPTCTTSIGSIFIFQGAKKKLKVLKKRSGRRKFDGSVAYIKQIYFYFWLSFSLVLYNNLIYIHFPPSNTYACTCKYTDMINHNILIFYKNIYKNISIDYA
jgi:hypothetical protein